MASNEQKPTGPQFVRYFAPVLKALSELGGSARPVEVESFVADSLKLSSEQQNETTKSGQSRFRNQIGWAKFYLAKSGYIDSSEHGVWSLTSSGKAVELTPEAALNLFKAIHKQWKSIDAVSSDDDKITDVVSKEDAEGLVELEIVGYREVLLNTLRSLPPTGFERICQRLLREAGFQQVTVTGKSGDGGIDGYGVLQVNPFVSFQVLFQCKRYDGSVTPEQVRAFRGAMHGRSDKGIIITTGTFTLKAREEATREGPPPIELVDAEKLVTMFEYLELGLKPRKTFEIDASFFDEFKK